MKYLLPSSNPSGTIGSTKRFSRNRGLPPKLRTQIPVRGRTEGKGSGYGLGRTHNHIRKGASSLS